MPPAIRSIDLLLLDDIFGMGGGYVLNFTNPSFARFFANELDVDICDPIYAEHGNSKAKRLRCFLQKADAATEVRTLKALWEYREELRVRSGQPEGVQNAEDRLLALIGRLEGTPEGKPEGSAQASRGRRSPRSIA